MRRVAAIDVRRPGPGDVAVVRALNRLFATVFDEPETYLDAPPDEAYLAALLARPHVIALAAFEGEALVGGLVAYELEKLEQARSEIYIYDLAVAETHRRLGIATALVVETRRIAVERGARVVFEQADQADPPAIALYDKLGTREEVLHFDIPVPAADRDH